jgi:hypothetical protein
MSRLVSVHAGFAGPKWNASSRHKLHVEARIHTRETRWAEIEGTFEARTASSVALPSPVAALRSNVPSACKPGSPHQSTAWASRTITGE